MNGRLVQPFPAFINEYFKVGRVEFPLPLNKNHSKNLALVIRRNGPQFQVLLYIQTTGLQER